MSSSLPRNSSTPLYHVLALTFLVLAVKSYYIFEYMPSMWVWGDEMIYYVTAYDLLNLGSAGVPHPQFLYYPPVTSMLISPVHLLGIPGEYGYRASLVVMSLVQALGVLASYLVVLEIFNLRSRLLVLLLLIGPPAYSGLVLMSETPYVAIFLWLVYFYVRLLKTTHLRHAVAVGLLAGLMILTRKAGIIIVASMVLAMVFELMRGAGADKWRRARSFGVILLIGLGVFTAWKVAFGEIIGGKYGGYGAAGYLKNGLLPALSDVQSFLSLMRKFLANMGYVSLSTYGVCVPLILCYCLSRASQDDDPARRDVIRRLMFLVLVFMLLSGCAAAMHMVAFSNGTNTRYLMYGRYMEYSSALLVAVSFGLLASGWPKSRSQRYAVVALCSLLSVLVSFVIPGQFFASPRIAASNMGIGWLIGLGGDSVAWLRTTGPVVAVALALIVTSSWFAEYARVRWLAYAAALALALLNLKVSGSRAAEKSQGFHDAYSAYSKYIDDHPELFSEGLLLDATSLTKRIGRKDRLLTQKVMADHVDKVVVEKKLKPAFGQVPILSHRRNKAYEVLYQAEGFSSRIYGTKEVPRKRP